MDVSNPLDYVGIVSNPQRNFEGYQSSVTFSLCCLIRRVFLFLRFENPSNQRGPHYFPLIRTHQRWKTPWNSYLQSFLLKFLQAEKRLTRWAHEAHGCFHTMRPLSTLPPMTLTATSVSLFILDTNIQNHPSMIFGLSNDHTTEGFNPCLTITGYSCKFSST